MRKGLFFSLPSVSVHKTLSPVIEDMAGNGFRMVHYNAGSFVPRDRSNAIFRSYPQYSKGYDTSRVNEQTSYFGFAEMLIDTAAAVFEFLLQEVKKERPDFIVHSHLALWGKLIAQYCRLPAVSLFTTFALDERIMIPHFRKNKPLKATADVGLNQIMAVNKKYRDLYGSIGLKEQPNIWDAYVNCEPLNLLFIPKEFQPNPQLFGPQYKFVGFPVNAPKQEVEKKMLYASMGTVFNSEANVFRMCVAAFTKINCACTISLGNKLDIQHLGHLPSNITVSDFVDQLSVLQQSMLFITRGGMASVQEAIYSLTPMIVIPEIPEQIITAEIIESLGIGIYIPSTELTEERLYQAILTVLQKKEYYREQIEKLKSNVPEQSASSLTLKYINNYLNNE